MLPIFALAAALVAGGGLLAKKMLVKDVVVKPSSRHAAPAIAAQRVDEFLERRNDGLYQFNRDTAVSILGWMGSVAAVPAPSGQPGVTVYDLVASSDGMPPAVGAAAGKILLAEAKSGKTVLVRRDITAVGVRTRRAAAAKGDLSSLAGDGGEYAVLIVPEAESVEPALGPMQGFEGGKRPVPGASELPETDESGAEKPVEELPADVRSMIEDLLKKSDGDPRALGAIARQLRLGGYPQAANMVESKAGDLHAADVVEAVELRTVFVIPKGHAGAMSLATRMTGDPRRAKDLLPMNPELSVTSDGRLRPWVPGQIVKLPASWTE
jgi:hypothetical protein